MYDTSTYILRTMIFEKVSLDVRKINAADYFSSISTSFYRYRWGISPVVTTHRPTNDLKARRNIVLYFSHLRTLVLSLVKSTKAIPFEIPFGNRKGKKGKSKESIETEGRGLNKERKIR